jgi:plasmid stability protein
MPTFVIPDVDETVLNRLRQRADAHGRSPEAEAKAILNEALRPPDAAWAAVRQLHQSLVSSGRSFSDSAELLREDRER